MMIDKNISPELKGKWEQTGEHKHKLVFSNQTYLLLDDTAPDCAVVSLIGYPYNETILNIRVNSKPMPLDELKKRAIQSVLANCENLGEIYTKIAIALGIIKVED